MDNLIDSGGETNDTQTCIESNNNNGIIISKKCRVQIVTIFKNFFELFKTLSTYSCFMESDILYFICNFV